MPMMEELHDQLPEGTQELIGVLGAVMGREFEQMMKSGANAEIINPDGFLNDIPEEDREGFVNHLHAVKASPDGFLAFMFTDGFRNGFCACLKSLALCEEFGVDDMESLLDELRRRAKATPNNVVNAMADILRRLAEDE